MSMIDERLLKMLSLGVPGLGNPLSPVQAPGGLSVPEQPGLSILGAGGGIQDNLASGALTAAGTGNPLIGAGMMALQAGTSILGNKQPAPQAPAPSVRGRDYPWQNTGLYQQAGQIPQTNFMSMLARMLRG